MTLRRPYHPQEDPETRDPEDSAPLFLADITDSSGERYLGLLDAQNNAALGYYLDGYPGRDPSLDRRTIQMMDDRYIALECVSSALTYDEEDAELRTEVGYPEEVDKGLTRLHEECCNWRLSVQEEAGQYR